MFSFFSFLRTLREWMDCRSCVCPADNVNLFRQVLEGVKYIHAQNIVHRDLKPKNIFLKADGCVSNLNFIQFASILAFVICQWEGS